MSIGKEIDDLIASAVSAKRRVDLGETKRRMLALRVYDSFVKVLEGVESFSHSFEASGFKIHIERGHMGYIGIIKTGLKIKGHDDRRYHAYIYSTRMEGEEVVLQEVMSNLGDILRALADSIAVEWNTNADILESRIEAGLLT